jgi:uncharacterized membrane protein
VRILFTFVRTNIKDMNRYYYPMHEVGYNGGPEAVISILAILVLAVVGVALVRHFFGSGKHHMCGTCGGHADAQSILDERYAKGEIGTEDYQERTKILSGK